MCPTTFVAHRDDAHCEYTHCRGMYHSPTQCLVIITQAYDYLLRIKASSIPIPPKPKEGSAISTQYPEHMVKPLPKRAREPKP